MRSGEQLETEFSENQGTGMLEEKSSYFSLGLNYLRVLSPSRKWGAGGFTEVIYTKQPDWVFGGLIYIWHIKIR